MQSRRRTCERVGAQILSPEAAIGGLVGGFEGAGDTAQEEEKAHWPMAVAGVAVRCCGCRGRPSSQPARGYGSKASFWSSSKKRSLYGA